MLKNEKKRQRLALEEGPRCYSRLHLSEAGKPDIDSASIRTPVIQKFLEKPRRIALLRLVPFVRASIPRSLEQICSEPVIEAISWDQLHRVPHRLPAEFGFEDLLHVRECL